MDKSIVKAKCEAYSKMIKAEAKFLEAKEQYYAVKKANPAPRLPN